MPWFRVHNDILEHPKLLMLAPSDRWYFVAILSLKSQGVLDDFEGDKLDRVICAKLRLTQAEWDECSRRLQEEHLIDDCYQPIGWESRQFKSDSSTERVRKHRARKRAEENGEASHETFHETLHETYETKSALHETSEVDESTAPPGAAREGKNAPQKNTNKINDEKRRNDDETLQKRRSNAEVTPPDTDTESDTDKPHSDPDGSAPGGAHAVDNSMKSLGEDYRDPSHEQLLFNRGAKFLGQYGIPDDKARAFLGMCKRDWKIGPTLDALVTAILSRPAGDPKAFILGVLANPAKPIENTWEPDAAVVAELEGLGIPINLIRRARETFVIWFRSMEIYHTDWPRLFRDWVIRDWEDAEFQAFQYRRRLAESAGFAYEPTFREPA